MSTQTEIFSLAELREIRSFYFTRLEPGERRILAAFENQLHQDAQPEARMAAFAELRRSTPLRDYLEAAEACRLAEKAAALGLSVLDVADPPVAGPVIEGRLSG